MDARYHREILERALGARLSARALDAIYRANVHQDRLAGLIGHPEFHFDDNAIAASLAYIEDNRMQTAQAETAPEAWAAFGRLTHAAQDFYAHSNYVRLWAEPYGPTLPPPATIDGLAVALLQHPRLMTCRVYLPWEALYFVPGLGPLMQATLPKDSHAWMNLDTPARGPLFPYALEAAVQRTLVEYERTLALIGEQSGDAAMQKFRDQ